MRMFSRSHLYRQRREVDVDCDRVDQLGCGRASGLVGESLYHVVRYVSAQRRRLGSSYRRHGGICGQRALCVLRRPRSAADPQLCQSLQHRGRRLSAGFGRSEPAGSRIKEGGACRMSLYCATGDVESDLVPQLQDLLAESLAKLGNRNRVRVVPPGHSRVHARSGDLTRYAWRYYGDRLRAVLPALGTHAAMQPEQITRMFGEIPQDLFRVHHWRTDVETLGEVPAEFIHEQSEGKLNYAWPAQVNRLITQGNFDLILSIGQVVPHEVIGMANYNKNILVGTGGRDSINRSHYLGAVYGMERIMGRAENPVRNVLNCAADRFLRHLPIVYVLTVIGRTADEGLAVRGLFIGDDAECFHRAAALSLKVNFETLDSPIHKAVVYLDPQEFHSTWLGNKAIYRTRMAVADGAELIVLAPGVRS